MREGWLHRLCWRTKAWTETWLRGWHSRQTSRILSAKNLRSRLDWVRLAIPASRGGFGFARGGKRRRYFPDEAEQLPRGGGGVLEAERWNLSGSRRFGRGYLRAAGSLPLGRSTCVPDRCSLR